MSQQPEHSTSTLASEALRTLASRHAAIYVERTRPRAILLTGSAAEGLSDFYSDLDLILYYDELPPEQAFKSARDQIGGEPFQDFGPRTDTNYAESHLIHGVECQTVHMTIAAWEETMAAVLTEHDTAPPLQKAISGLLEGMPLHGTNLITAWQERARQYPDGLARAVIQKHMRFSPVWYISDRMRSRDAGIWLHELLVQNAYNVLAVLAALNREYFSSLQFKRAGRFLDRLKIAPEYAAERLESLFAGDANSRVQAIETLVRDTLQLLAQHMPEVDQSAIRFKPGDRQQPWSVREFPI